MLTRALKLVAIAVAALALSGAAATAADAPAKKPSSKPKKVTVADFYFGPEKLTLKKDYDPEKEIFVWEGPGETIQLHAGSYLIFFPHDAHRPRLLIDRPRPVRKIVVKVAVE